MDALPEGTADTEADEVGTGLRDDEGVESALLVELALSEERADGLLDMVLEKEEPSLIVCALLLLGGAEKEVVTPLATSWLSTSRNAVCSSKLTPGRGMMDRSKASP
jgi:hypothetical protein